jgi:hypothetical protein
VVGLSDPVWGQLVMLAKIPTAIDQTLIDDLFFTDLVGGCCSGTE